MLNSPGYLMQKCIQKANYNLGRIYKEAGLGKWDHWSLTVFKLQVSTDLAVNSAEMLHICKILHDTGNKCPSTTQFQRSKMLG